MNHRLERVKVDRNVILSVLVLDGMITSSLDGFVIAPTNTRSLMEGIVLKCNNNNFPSNPWFDYECKTLKRTLNDYSKWHNLSIDQFRQEYSLLKKKYKYLIQMKKRNYQSSLCHEIEIFYCNNQNGYWKFWDKLKNTNKSHTVGKLTLKTFESYFADILSPSDCQMTNFDLQSLNFAKTFIADYNFDANNSTHMIDPPITVSEVAEQIKRLKMGKVPGIDGIGNEFFKSSADKLMLPFTTLFNYIFER